MGATGGGDWGQGFTQLSKQSLNALVEYEEKVVEERTCTPNAHGNGWGGGGGWREVKSACHKR